MAKKKRKRVEPPDPAVIAFIKRHPKAARRSAIAASLLAVAAVLFFIADPFGSGPTAIDGSGEEVRVGVIDWESAAAGDSAAPNFVLADYDRRAVRLEDFAGKTVFLNFWASWCGPCEREMPSILRIAREHPDEVVVLAVNRGESMGTAQGWTRGHGFAEDLPNFYWLVDESEAVWRAYRSGQGMPQSYFLSSDGVIRQDVQQGMEYEDMLSRLEHALAFDTTFDDPG